MAINIFEEALVVSTTDENKIKVYVEIEDLYQSFKQRLIKEVFVQSTELLDYADLIDLEEI